MNAQEHHEVGEITDRLDRMVTLAYRLLGGMGTIALGALLWAWAISDRVTQLESITKGQGARIERVDTSTGEAVRSLIDMGREVSAMRAKQDSQGQTLRRIDRNLEALAKRLEGRE